MAVSSISLAAAVADLKLVQSLISAIDARAPGLGGSGQVERGVDRYEPRRVIHPDPRYMPRQVLHPTPRYLPRPVLHPTPRINEASTQPCKNPPSAPSPGPFLPPWRLPLAVHSHPQTQILKIAAPRFDILNKGTLIDLFI